MMAKGRVPAFATDKLSPLGLDFAHALNRRGHSPSTTEGYLLHARMFEAFLIEHGVIRPLQDGEKPAKGELAADGWAYKPKALDYKLLLSYLDTLQGLSPRTISARFTSVGKYVRHLEWHHEFPRVDMERFWEEEPRNITKQIKRLRARRINTPPGLEEVQRALAVEGSLRNRVFLLVALKTGARRNELLALDWSDIDLNQGRVHFKDDGQHFKRTTYEGLLDYETITALRLWRAAWTDLKAPGEQAVFISESGPQAGRRMGRSAALGLVTKAFGRLELSYNVHSLRHWFSDTLRAKGMHDHMISYLRGDAPQLTHDLYTHLQSGRASLRAAYDAAMPAVVVSTREIVAGLRRHRTPATLTEEGSGRERHQG